VYVGAISILFLFVIMITETGKTPAQRGMNKESNIYAITILLLFTIPLIYSYIQSLNFDNNDFIMEYFVPSYNTEFLTITDIQSLGYVIYLAYPIIIVL
jgi:NADH:ubiquinone oxidoreductase subunit 6 (subunit J)